MFLETLHGYPTGSERSAVRERGEDWLTACAWLLGFLVPWALIGWFLLSL